MPQTKQQHVDIIEKTWDQLVAALEDLDYGRSASAIVFGDWTLTDLLGHITTWEQEAIRNIEAMLDPNDDPRQYPNVDEFNAAQIEAHRELPDEEIRGQFMRNHKIMSEYLDGLPDSAFEREDVRRRLKLDTYEHYEEHQADIERLSSES